MNDSLSQPPAYRQPEWKVVIAACTLLASIIISYATAMERINDQGRRMEKVEKEAVPYPVYEQNQREIERRLGRIEDKIDRRNRN